MPCSKRSSATLVYILAVPAIDIYVVPSRPNFEPLYEQVHQIHRGLLVREQVINEPKVPSLQILSVDMLFSCHLLSTKLALRISIISSELSGQYSISVTYSLQRILVNDRPRSDSGYGINNSLVSCNTSTLGCTDTKHSSESVDRCSDSWSHTTEGLLSYLRPRVNGLLGCSVAGVLSCTGPRAKRNKASNSLGLAFGAASVWSIGHSGGHGRRENKQPYALSIIIMCTLQIKAERVSRALSSLVKALEVLWRGLPGVIFLDIRVAQVAWSLSSNLPAMQIFLLSGSWLLGIFHAWDQQPSCS
ncbi:hypothetical protein VNO77_27519 [Canavalia gladiata]|uniref:Uncharacterized protein n=1 Tax=Canavalia gladiata TaxID=3824 RepID=A0AAN9KXF7_CANGL